MRSLPTYRRLMILVTLFTLAGFPGGFALGTQDKDKGKSANKGKIEGTKWNSLETIIKGAKIPAGALKLEFGKDGKLTYIAGPKTFTGTYELGDGDTVTFHLDQELAGNKKHVEKVVIKENRLILTDQDGTSISFEKVKLPLGKAKEKGASSNKGKIEGTKWNSLEAIVKGNKIPAAALKLEFSKDGKLVYQAGAARFTGTYVLGEGETVTFHLDQELAGRKDHIEKVAIRGTRLVMTDADGTSLTFKKVN
jgi:hypothetical protein